MNRKSTRITIYDIARELNISPSTVTRALNNQSCISDTTRRNVQQTARRMGYQRTGWAAAEAPRSIKLGLILRNKLPEYQNLIIAGAKRACSELAAGSVELEYCILDVQDYGKRLVDKVQEMIQNGCSGISFTMGPESCRDALRDALRGSNVKTSTIYGDVCKDFSDFFVGADYRTSGMMAVDLFHMCGLKRGDVVAHFTGSRSFPQHDENYAGFLDLANQYGFSVRLIEHQDNEKIAYLATEQLLTEEPELKGIFCSTAISIPVCEKLIEMGRAQDIVLVGTDLLTACIPYIQDDTMNAVIFQNPFKLGYLSCKTMAEYLSGTPLPRRGLFINPQIVIRGNLEHYVDRITNIETEY